MPTLELFKVVSFLEELSLRAYAESANAIFTSLQLQLMCAMHCKQESDEEIVIRLNYFQMTYYYLRYSELKAVNYTSKMFQTAKHHLH